MGLGVPPCAAPRSVRRGSAAVLPLPVCVPRPTRANDAGTTTAAVDGGEGRAAGGGGGGGRGEAREEVNLGVGRGVGAGLGGCVGINGDCGTVRVCTVSCLEGRGGTAGCRPGAAATVAPVLRYDVIPTL